MLTDNTTPCQNKPESNSNKEVLHISRTGALPSDAFSAIPRIPLYVAQSAGVAEYTDCISAEEQDPRPTSDAINWSYRIHRLHFCRGIRLPQRVSWI